MYFYDMKDCNRLVHQFSTWYMVPGSVGAVGVCPQCASGEGLCHVQHYRTNQALVQQRQPVVLEISVARSY